MLTLMFHSLTHIFQNAKNCREMSEDLTKSFFSGAAIFILLPGFPGAANLLVNILNHKANAEVRIDDKVGGFFLCATPWFL